MYFVRYKCGSGRVGNFVLHDGSGRVQKRVTRGQLCGTQLNGIATQGTLLQQLLYERTAPHPY